MKKFVVWIFNTTILKAISVATFPIALLLDLVTGRGSLRRMIANRDRVIRNLAMENGALRGIVANYQADLEDTAEALQVVMDQSEVKQWFFQLKVPPEDIDSGKLWMMITGNLIHPPILCSDPKNTEGWENWQDMMKGDRKNLKTQIMEEGGIPDFMPKDWPPSNEKEE